MTKRAYRITVLAVTTAIGLPLSLSAQDRPVGEAPVDRYEVGRALPPSDPERELVTLTLEQAITRALETNLDIQSARLSPRMQAFSLQAARAAFTPTLNGS